MIPKELLEDYLLGKGSRGRENLGLQAMDESSPWRDIYIVSNPLIRHGI